MSLYSHRIEKVSESGTDKKEDEITQYDNEAEIK
jgi:hypothetical protein